MPKYVIEREIPGVGGSSTEELKNISITSCNVLRNMGPEEQAQNKDHQNYPDGGNYLISPIVFFHMRNQLILL